VKPQISCAARLHPGWSDVLRPWRPAPPPAHLPANVATPRPPPFLSGCPKVAACRSCFLSSDAQPGIGLHRPPDCYASCCRARCCLVLLARFGAHAGGWCRVLLRDSGSCNLLAVIRSDTRPAAMTSPSELGCGMAASRERMLAVTESTRRRICRGTG
jgi:hypothetical protein